MEGNVSGKASVGHWLFEEIASFTLLAVYFFVCFAALLYLKFSILEAQGVSFAPWGFAALKALIVAKFVLVSRHLDRHPKDDTRPLIIPTINRSLAMLALLVVLMVIEEIAVAFIHGRGVGTALAEIGGGTLHQRIATIAVLLLILIPFFAFRSLGEAVGNQTLVRLFFRRRQRKDDDRSG